MTNEHKKKLDAWWTVVRPSAVAADAALRITRSMKVSERVYALKMADYFKRYNHPAILTRLVLDEKWAMVAAEQSGNVVA